MGDRSSIPRHQPGRTPAHIEQQVVGLRTEHRIGPVRLAARTGPAASTCHRILRRHGLPPLTALDDHSRLAYSEILTDEKAATCAGFLRRAHAWFAANGITVQRVLTDNAWAYTKTTWRRTCAELDIAARWTRPWRPQTNGKVERFHRTLATEWAYARLYSCEAERQAAYPDFLDWYNYHRPHTGIGGQVPAARVTNLTEQHI